MLVVRIGNRLNTWSQKYFAHKELTYHATAIWASFFVLTLITALLFKIPGFTFLGFIVLCILFLLFGRYLLFAVTSISYLIKETKKISDGDLTHKINETEVTPSMRVLSKYINNISSL